MANNDIPGVEFMFHNTRPIVKPKRKKKYGIYSTKSKRFVFGIEQETKSKAWVALRQHIGTDSFKYRFEVKEMKRENN